MYNLIFLIFFNCLITFFLIKYFIKITHKTKFIDNKNPHYSNNAVPTGGGIIFLIVFTLNIIFLFIFDKEFFLFLPNKYYLFFLCLIFLVVISFIDDYKNLDPILRLISQIFLIYLSITAIPLSLIELPQKLVFLLAVISWIYIMNIHNFIDGSDGMLSLTCVFFFLNSILINFYTGKTDFSYYLSFIILPILVIFLIFNKPKAKIFMGDAGSIFLGFIIGYVVLDLFVKGYWYYSISLIIYPLVDCTITLIKKVRKGYMP